MKICTAPLALALSLPFLAAAAPSHLRSQGPQPPSTPWFSFTGGSTALKRYSNQYSVRAIPSPGESRVVLRYYSAHSGTPSQLFPLATGNRIHTREIYFATRYWPIGIEWIDGTDDAIVMGISPADGDTVIFERWSFNGNQLPLAIQQSPPGGGSGGAIGWTLPNRKRVDLLWSVRTTDLGMTGIPSFIKENGANGTHNRFFIGERGAPRIYDLDLGTKSSVLAASASPAQNPMVVAPDLSVEDWQVCQGLRHADDGVIYQIASRDQQYRNIIFLVDSNADGTLDAWTRNTVHMPRYGVLDTAIDSRF